MPSPPVKAFSENCPHADVFFYGGREPDHTGFSFDLVVLERLRSQSVKTASTVGCVSQDGAAAVTVNYKWLIASGGGEFSGFARCHVTRELTNDQILDRIATSGGLFWHDPPGNELLNRDDKDSSKART